MIVFGKTTLNDDVKNWSFAKLKKKFEGKIDYISLAKQLGIKEDKPEKEAKKPKNSTEK